MPLTQPGPSAWRPSTRASVVSSPVRTASRRSGPSHLETRPDGGPALAAGDQRVPRRAGHRSEVVVLDDERVVRPAPRAARPARAASNADAARVVAARRDHDGARAVALGLGERVRDHPALVDRHRREPQPERAREVEHAGPAGVLDGDASPGARCAASTRSMPSSAPLTAHTRAAGMPSAANAARATLGQLRQHRLLAVEPLRRLELAQRRREVGQQRRVRAARHEVARAGGHARRSRASAAEAGPPPACRCAGARPRHPVAAGRPCAAATVVGAHAEVCGGAPHRGHRAFPAAAARRRCRPPRSPRSRSRRSPAADTVPSTVSNCTTTEGSDPP